MIDGRDSGQRGSAAEYRTAESTRRISDRGAGTRTGARFQGVDPNCARRITLRTLGNPEEVLHERIWRSSHGISLRQRRDRILYHHTGAC